MYDDQIKLKYDHGAMGRENQGEERRENQGEDQEERNQICLEPKPLQHIQTLIQTPTNQTIRPQLKNTQIWFRVEVRQEERRKSRRVTRIVWKNLRINLIFILERVRSDLHV